MTRERFRITLSALPSDTPAIIRLRAALKLFLRRFALRCTAAVQLPEDAPPPSVRREDGHAIDP